VVLEAGKRDLKGVSYDLVLHFGRALGLSSALVYVQGRFALSSLV
jgi:hypothetical protein